MLKLCLVIDQMLISGHTIISGHPPFFMAEIIALFRLFMHTVVQLESPGGATYRFSVCHRRPYARRRHLARICQVCNLHVVLLTIA